MVGLEEIEPSWLLRPAKQLAFSLLCQREEVGGVGIARRVVLLTLSQQLESVLADRFQHAESRTARGGFGAGRLVALDQAVIDQHPELVQGRERGVAAHRRGRLQVEAAGEDRQATEQ